MNRVQILTFGQPEVRVDGCPLHFPTRKALALLLYLAVEREALARDRLLALLWPDSEETAARASLRTELSRLRRAIAPAGPLLVAESGTIRFQPPAPGAVDIHLLQAAAATEETGEAPPATDLWQKALAAYRGPFLDPFSLPDNPDFDDWQMFHQERSHRQVSQIFHRLAERQLAQHRPDEAVATATGWLRHDPLSEKAVRCLMQAHYLQGDRRAALEAYDTFTARLAADLQLQPAPLLSELAETIRHTHRGRPRQQPQRPAPRPADNLPFVGRSREYAQLVGAYRALDAAGTQALILTGADGIGKTRLAREFLLWVEAQGGDILQGQTYRAGARLPFQPLTDALRDRLERENAPDDLLDDVWLAELTQLLPELRARYPDLPPPGAVPELARPRLFEAIERLGEALARPRPLVWLLDDWQWADQDSLNMLHYLGRHWRKRNVRCLFLLALFPEPIGPTGRLAPWLADWKRHIPVTTLPLSALSAAETTALVSAWAAAPTTGPDVGRFSRLLHAKTAGLPLRLAQTLGALDDGNQPGPAQNGPDLSQMLRRLEHVSPRLGAHSPKMGKARFE